MNFTLYLILLRVGAVAALVWLRLHPAEWSPLAYYLLRGVCWACIAASLTRRFIIIKNAMLLRPANMPWWRVLAGLR